MNMNEFNAINDRNEQVIKSHGVNATRQFDSLKSTVPSIGRKLIDSKTLAAITGLSASSRYRYIKKGLLPQPVRWPGCKNLWDLHEVSAYIERNNAKARMASLSPDKVEGVEGMAHDIFSVNDLKNKSAEASYTPYTAEGKIGESMGGQA